MSFNIYMNELEELYAQSYKAQQNKTLHKDFKSTLPKWLGDGHVKAKALNNLLFVEQHFNLHKEINISDANNHTKADYCFINFTLEGNNYFKVNNQKRSYLFSKNHASLGISKNAEKFELDIKDTNIWQYSFSLSRDALLDYLVELDNPQLIKQVQDAEKFELFNQIKLSPSHHHMIQKMTSNPYNGSLKNLYFETSANELFISLLEDLGRKKLPSFSLNKEDEMRVHNAKKILLNDIQNPPNIEELVKLSGLNKRKLTQGFNVLFGNTIFKTLTEQRMKIAYLYVQQNEMRVHEIAFEAGYENVSKFISTFKKEFGMTPGEMRKSKKYYFNYLT